MKGLLPPKEVAHWRAPRREDFPQPLPSEVVSLVAFHEHELGYPAHWFLHGLLNEWGLELQHLNPTGVLHIAGFVTDCEAFLGMEPHMDFFRWLFSGRSLLGGASPCRRNLARGVVLYQKPGGGTVPGIHRQKAREAGKLVVGPFLSREEEGGDHRGRAPEARAVWS